MDANDRAALEQARRNADRARSADSGGAEDQAAEHRRLCIEIVRRGPAVAAELARRGYPGVRELRFSENKPFLGMKDFRSKRRTMAGWSFYSLGDGGDTGEASTVNLLSNGGIVLSGGSPVSEGDVFHTLAHAQRILASLNSLIE